MAKEEFYISINVGIRIARYHEFEIILLHRGEGFIHCLHRPQHSRLNRPVHKDVELTTD